eukprot:gene933-799_t
MQLPPRQQSQVRRKISLRSQKSAEDVAQSVVLIPPISPSNKRFLGRVTHWIHEKGYGFVTCYVDNRDCFVHNAQIVVDSIDTFRCLVPDLEVEFDLEGNSSQDGRKASATNITLPGGLPISAKALRAVESHTFDTEGNPRVGKHWKLNKTTQYTVEGGEKQWQEWHYDLAQKGGSKPLGSPSPLDLSGSLGWCKIHQPDVHLPDDLKSPQETTKLTRRLSVDPPGVKTQIAKNWAKRKQSFALTPSAKRSISAEVDALAAFQRSSESEPERQVSPVFEPKSTTSKSEERGKPAAKKPKTSE